MNKEINSFFRFVKESYFKMTSFLSKNSIITSLLVFSFFLATFLLVYINLPVLSSGDDHYFHFRFASRLLDDGFFNSFRNFKTIYFTGIAQGDHFLYYNFIFYLVLIPFTFITPLFLAIKLYAIVSVSLIGIILYLIFRKLDIKYAFLWAVGFFTAIGLGSFWRLFLSRPFVLSPLIILLLLLAIHKKKYFWIFILSFIPLFWHTATFFVPILAATVYFLCYGFYYREYLWREIGLVFLGVFSAVSVANMIDPGFFISIRDNLFSVLSDVLNLSGNSVVISEGNEVYPKNFFDLLNQNYFLCLLFILSVVFYALNFLKDIKKAVFFPDELKKRKIITMVFFVISTIFIVAIPVISNRFSDFFIFFSWIFIVLVFSEIFSFIEFKDIQIRKFAGYAVLVCLVYFFLNNTLQLNDMFATRGSHPETFSEVGNYLSKNLKKGDVVYDVTWNWFSQLYYYAPDQNYVIGLEPKLTYLYSPRLYWLWQNIAKGYVCEKESCPDVESESTIKIRNKKEYVAWTRDNGNKIADIIINDFQSHYIVSSTEYAELNFTLNNNKRFKRVVNSNNKYFVYRVLEASK